MLRVSLSNGSLLAHISASMVNDGTTSVRQTFNLVHNYFGTRQEKVSA